MSMTVFIKNYSAPPICKSEILRYAGCRSLNPEVEKLLDECINEIDKKLEYKICYIELPVTVDGDKCDFSAFSLCSSQLAKNLNGCENALIFSATTGIYIDRLIAKYGHISPAKALMFQAIGAERIESLCNTFCNDFAKSNAANLRPRFSPGYGDLPLDSQKDIFKVLNCSKNIGLTLNNSLIMSPSKSVTAIAGITDEKDYTSLNKCALCDLKKCAYRGAL